jgi:phosphoribosylanthranilate isomerase
VTWVKICGITNLDDALTAVEAGADALGFVFHQNSPRNIDAHEARKIVARLPSHLETVGVFVKQTLEQIHETAQRAGLSAVQLHGYEPSATQLIKLLNSYPQKLFIALSAPMLFEQPTRLNGFDLRPQARKQISGIFLDSGAREQPGGTGKAVDWTRAVPIASMISKTFNLVVAGGLNPDNVRAAIDILKPWGVDVSSGVETKPGKKDASQVRAFINRARQADSTT